MSTYSTRLIRSEEVALGTRAFHLEKPAGFEFRPGQAMEIILPGAAEGDDGHHAFSIVSAPHEAELVFATRMRESTYKRHLASCPISCDHIPHRSWAFFQAREVMRDVVESFKREQST